jgi:quercetin dioxygenase-like cupin family protein
MAYSGQLITNPVSGERIRFRQTARDTGGRFLSFDLFLTPDGHVPGAHVHPIQEERFTVVSGHLQLRCGLRTIVAGEGETVVVPPGTVHKFVNAGDGPAHAVVRVEPALRMEDLLETAALLAQEGRTLPSGMPRPLDFAIFLHEFEQEVRVPLLPNALVRLASSPLEALGRRRGLDVYYRRQDRPAAA